MSTASGDFYHAEFLKHELRSISSRTAALFYERMRILLQPSSGSDPGRRDVPSRFRFVSPGRTELANSGAPEIGAELRQFVAVSDGV